MNKRILAVFVLLLTVLTGCGQQTEKTDEAIKIGLLRIDDSVPFYVAEQEDLFKKAGLNVELVSFSSSSDQALAMEAGELDMAMNDMIVQCLMKKNSFETKAVEIAYGAEAAEGRFLVVAAPNSGIKEPADLLGKNVGISSNTMMDYLFEKFEDIYGLDAEKINKVNMPNLALRLEAVLNGKDLDAAILPDPLAAYAVAEGCTIVVDDTKLGVNLSRSVVLADADFLKNNEEKTKLLLKCYAQAKELLNDNPEKYRTLALEVANVPASLAESYPAPKYTVGVLPDEEYVNDVVAWLMKRGLIDEKYTYEDLVWDGN